MVDTCLVLRSPLTEAQLDRLFEWLQDDSRIDTESADLEFDRRRIDERPKEGVYCSFEGLTVSFQHYEPPEFEYNDAPTGFKYTPFVNVYAEDLKFDSSARTPSETVATYLEATIALYEFLIDVGARPLYGIGVGPEGYQVLSDELPEPSPDTYERLAAMDEPLPRWHQIFSPDLADQIGRDRLESVPAWNVETLSDGAVQVVRWPNPHYTAPVNEEYQSSDFERHFSADGPVEDFPENYRRDAGEEPVRTAFSRWFDLLDALGETRNPALYSLDLEGAQRFADVADDEEIAVVRFEEWTYLNAAAIALGLYDITYDPTAFPGLLYDTDASAEVFYLSEEGFAVALGPDDPEAISTLAERAENPEDVKKLYGEGPYDVELTTVGELLD